MPQINPLVQSYGLLTRPNSAPDPIEQANSTAREAGETDRAAANRESRLFRLTPAPNQLAQLNRQTRNSPSNLPFTRQSPTQQYQANQNILRQQELETIVGVDLFA